MLHWIKNLSMFEQMMMMMMREVKVLMLAVKMTIKDNEVFR